MTQKISIIVPAFNKEKTIKKCVESLLDQTHENLEIIIVNDCSKDDTLKICKELEGLDDRIKIINNIKNQGLSQARKIGVQNATGEYIQFVDADDYIEKDMCLTLLELILRNQAEVVVCGYKLINGEKIILRNSIDEVVNSEQEFKKYFLYALENSLFNCVWNKLYKREKIKESYFKNIRLYEDLLFNLSYFTNVEKIVFVNDNLYNYVKQQGSLSSFFDEDMLLLGPVVSKEVKRFCINYFNDYNISYDPFFLREIYCYLDSICSDRKTKKSLKMQNIRKIVLNNYVQAVSRGDCIGNKNLRVVSFLIRKKLFELIFLFFSFKQIVLSIEHRFFRKEEK